MKTLLRKSFYTVLCAVLVFYCAVFPLHADDELPGPQTKVNVGIIDTGFDGGHGSNVRAILSALGGSALGNIICADASDPESGAVTAVSVANAINNMVSQVHIINISFGTEEDSPVLLEAVNNARQNGVLVVCAAGNDGPDKVLYPAGYDSALSVMASEEGGAKWSLSGQGDIAAPGVNIACQDGTVQSGTSLAVPVVSAAAARVLSAAPEISIPRLFEILVSTADTEGGIPVVNADAAVQEAKGTEQTAVSLSGVTIEKAEIENGSYVTDWADRIGLFFQGVRLTKDVDYRIREGSLYESAEGDRVLLAVTYEGIGGYTGSIDVSIDTGKISINECEYRLSGTYSAAAGESAQPKVTLTYLMYGIDKPPLTLSQDTDYTLAYGSNDTPGKNAGSITVTGTGLYTGEMEIRFTVYDQDGLIETRDIGDNIVCMIYADGTLFFEGSGEMGLFHDSFGRIPHPLAALTDRNGNELKAVKAVIGEGITSVSNGFFYKFNDLREVILPESLKTIGYQAFYKCSSLKTISFPEGLESINGGAFSSSGLTNVEFRGNDTELGQEVFYKCTQLEHIRLPENITSLKMGLLQNCSALQEISIPEKVTEIETTALAGLSKIKELIIPDNVKIIGMNAFQGWKALKKITIPSTVTTLSSMAFQGCSALEEVTVLPGSVTDITGAFHNCRSIKIIRLPVSVSVLGESTFSVAKGADLYYAGTREQWDQITIDASAFKDTVHVHLEGEPSVTPGTSGTIGDTIAWSLDDEGVLTVSGTGELPLWHIVTKNYTLVFDPPWGNNVKEMIISEEISGAEQFTPEEIPETEVRPEDEIRVTAEGTCGDNAFWTLDENGNLHISGSGEINAFKNEKNIWAAYSDKILSITIGDGLTGIGSRSFAFLKNLKTVRISGPFEKIGDAAFYGCSSLKTFANYGNSLKTIGAGAFGYCTSLTRFEMYGGLEFLGDLAFFGCSSMTYCAIGVNRSPLTRIGDYTFYGCTSLNFLRLPVNLKTIGDYAFYRSGITVTALLEYTERRYVVLPATLQSVGIGSFADCTSLQKAEFENPAASIGAYAFYHDPLLEEVVLPADLTVLADGTFAYCDSLISPNGTEENITLGENVYAEESDSEHVDLKPPVETDLDGLYKELANYTGSMSAACDHVYITDKNEATCTSEGYERKICTRCGAIENGSEKIIRASGHLYDGGKVIMASAVNKAGIIEYTCLYCGSSYRENIPALTPAPTISPAPKPTVSPEPKPTVSPEPKPTVSPEPKPTVSPEPKPTVSPAPKPTVSPAPKPTVSPELKPTVSPELKPTVSPESSVTPGPADSPSQTNTARPSSASSSNAAAIPSSSSNRTNKPASSSNKTDEPASSSNKTDEATSSSVQSNANERVSSTDPASVSESAGTQKTESASAAEMHDRIQTAGSSDRSADIYEASDIKAGVPVWIFICIASGAALAGVALYIYRRKR